MSGALPRDLLGLVASSWRRMALTLSPIRP
jgi:hypothetical protein